MSSPQPNGDVASETVKRPRTRSRRVVFFTIVCILLIVIQTPAPVLLLTNLVSAEEAMRLATTLRAATPGLLVALVVTFLYERSKDAAYARSEAELARTVTDAVRTAVSEEDDARFERLSGQSPPERLVEAGIQRLYGTGTRLDNLVDTLLPTRGLLRDVDVTFTMRDNGDDADTYALDIYYRAMARNLPEFVAAYVVGNDTASLLHAQSPRVTNVFSFDNEQGVESAAAKATSEAGAFKFMVEQEENGRFGEIINGPLERVPEDDFIRYDVPTSGPDDELIVLLRRQIPDGDQHNVVYMITSSGVSDSSSRFVYYFEDRPAYVRRVAFDWSGMRTSRDADAPRHIVPFFIPRGQAPEVDQRAKKADVAVEQWVMPGGGALLVW